ncbi:MAG: hypothetical protein ABSH20_17800 [Tepidisphaeraceae bacterium]|jgi:hypothetical protein
MDLFIQKNFFSGPAQIAFVTDPLGGQEAIIANAGGKIEPVSKFWVDGRERQCSGAEAKKEEGVSGAVPPGLTKSLRAMEDRINSLVQTVEGDRAFSQRFILFVGMLVAVGVVFWIASQIWVAFSKDPIPQGYTTIVPMTTPDGKVVRLGIHVVAAELAPEQRADLMRQLLEMAQRENEEAAKKAAAATQPATKPAEGKGK